MHAFNGEDEFVLAKVPVGFFVDIGAGDGVTWSNSRALYEAGWSGVCVECDENKLANLDFLYGGSGVKIIKKRIDAATVAKELLAVGVPESFEFLSIDIDGMDAWVAQAVLEVFSPRIIICEFNHLVPPPIRFCMKYAGNFVWGKNQMFGASLQHFYDVLAPRYGLVRCFLNNAAFEYGAESVGTPTELWENQVVPAAIKNAGAHTIPTQWPEPDETAVSALADLFPHDKCFLGLSPIDCRWASVKLQGVASGQRLP